MIPASQVIYTQHMHAKKTNLYHRYFYYYYYVGFITLTEEIKDNMGEGSVNDLAEHLVSSGSDLGVNDFIHRCLMQGLARGLWHHVDGTWQITE